MKYCYINADRRLDPYSGIVRDLRENDMIPYIKYPDEYSGEAAVKLCCTQHRTVDLSTFEATITEREQRRITDNWAGFLSGGGFPLQEVQFCTLTPQRIFDAVCNQANIESLRFKWLKTKSLNGIGKLRNLKKLYIECGSSLTDISAVSELSELDTLILGSTTALTDYSALAALKKLQTLVICSYQSRVPEDIMKMESDGFIADMPSLRYLDLADVRIFKRTYLNEQSAARFDFACFAY